MVQRRNKRRDAGEQGYGLRLEVAASGGATSGYTVPPRLALNYGFLIWPEARINEWQLPPATTEPILFEFSRLWVKPDEKIASFAVNWGPLEIDRQLEELYRQRFAGSMFAEPVLAWRNKSRRMMAVLGAAADLRAGLPLSVEDWSWFETTSISITGLELDLDFITPGSGRLASDPDLLAIEVRNWYERYPVPIALARNQFPFQMEIQIETTGSRLAMELMSALSQEPGIYRCSRCTLPYWPQWRKPREGEHHYCPTCVIEARRERNLAAWHRNKAKYRPPKSAEQGDGTDEEAR